MLKSLIDNCFLKYFANLMIYHYFEWLKSRRNVRLLHGYFIQISYALVFLCRLTIPTLSDPLSVIVHDTDITKANNHEDS